MNLKKRTLPWGFLTRFILIVFAISAAAYSYIDRQNQLTALRRKIPDLQKKLRKVREDNTRLQYEIDTFESPVHLMELARKPEFGHLKYPSERDVIIIDERDER